MLFCLSYANITHFRKKNNHFSQKQNILNKYEYDFAKFIIYQKRKIIRILKNKKQLKL